MACNVFGTPVNLETLKGIPEYADKETITRQDLAEVAINLKNAEGKDINARSYVENMYKRYDNIHCALGLIYNATGAPLKFHNFWNWYSFVAPSPFPAFIENGQWGAFLCVSEKKSQGDEGCAGTVIYRGFGLDGTSSELDHFIGWDTHFLPKMPKVCVDIEDIGSPSDYQRTDWQKNKVWGSGQQHNMVEKKGLLSSAMIGSDKMAVLEVIIGPKLNPTE